MGFTDFDMASAPKFVGLQNFYTLFLADDVFIQSIRTTLIFAICQIPALHFYKRFRKFSLLLMAGNFR